MQSDFQYRELISITLNILSSFSLLFINNSSYIFNKNLGYGLNQIIFTISFFII